MPQILYLIQWKEEEKEFVNSIWVDSFEIGVDAEAGQMKPCLTYTLQSRGMIAVIPRIENFEFHGQKTFTQEEYDAQVNEAQDS